MNIRDSNFHPIMGTTGQGRGAESVEGVREWGGASPFQQTKGCGGKLPQWSPGRIPTENNFHGI